MPVVRQMSDRPNVAFNELDVVTALKVLKVAGDGIDFFVWLRKYRGVKFSVLLIHGGSDVTWTGYIKNLKRETDILFKVDDDTYLIVAQETNGNGNIVFAKKILESMMNTNENVAPFASIVDVESEGEDLQARRIIFEAVKNYVEFFHQPRDIRKGRVSYKQI